MFVYCFVPIAYMLLTDCYLIYDKNQVMLPHEQLRNDGTLHCVNKVWPAIALNNFLFFGERIERSVAATRAPSLVLLSQRKVHKYGTTQQEQCLVADNDSVASPEAGSLRFEIDVGRYNPVEVAPADRHAYHNSTLERSFDIIRNPR